MKFTNGYWMLRYGVDALYARQAFEINIGEDGESLDMLAPTSVVRDRAGALNQPVFEVRVTSPAEGVIRVQARHWLGAGKHPGFPLNEDDSDERSYIHVTMDGDGDGETGQDGATATLTSGPISARVTKGELWRLEFLDADGHPLTMSTGKSLARFRLSEHAAVAAQPVGEFGVSRTGAAYDESDVFASVQLRLGVGEQVYGLGERFGPFVKNGQTVDIWNEDGGTASEQGYKDIPFYLTSNGYGVLVNHRGHVSFEVGSENTEVVQFSVPGEGIDFCVIAGPEPKQVLERYTALRYADYAAVLARAFGDRVDTWTTLNEPWCTAYLGYCNGVHAPGVRDDAKSLAAVHHLNLAHGLGIQAVRAELGEKTRMSVTLNLQVTRAATNSPADLAARRRADLFANEVWLGPMLEGRYDPEILEASKHITDWSFIHDGDLEAIHQPLDVLGINYYSTTYVRHRDPAQTSVKSDKPIKHENAMPAQESVETLPPEGELTAMGWNQEPEGLRDILVELSRCYPSLPLMVTENGSAWDDEVAEDDTVTGIAGPEEGMIAVVPGRIVHDPKRVAYLNAHVNAVHDAIDQGANVNGYYAWSLLDNFEWAFGYSKRFGIVRVDYDTQERIWKDSALRFRDIARNNAI